jgi:competence protein ComEC
MEKFFEYVHWWLCVFLATLIFGVLWGIFFVQKEKFLNVSFLDVGQGDAIYIEAPNGNQILIDAGPDRGVLTPLGDSMNFFDRSFDMVIETHPDKDHIGGFIDILENYHTTAYMYPDVQSDTEIYARLQDILTINNIEKIVARRGMRIHIDTQKGIFMDVMYPDGDVADIKDRNEGSIILKLFYGENTFLFTGDAGVETEHKLIKVFDYQTLNVSVLKLGHHGSRTSTSQEFLVATTPELAIISAGKDNTYGHPHEEVLTNIGLFAIPFLSTADFGTIVLKSDGQNIFTKQKPTEVGFEEEKE